MRSSDGHIINKCLNGEPEAFGLLVDKYRMGVYSLAYSKLRNFHDAEDIAQEVFIKAYKNLHNLKRYDSFHVWLYAITSNLCKDWFRKQSARPDNEYIEEHDIETRSTDNDSNISDMVHEALESLPEIHQQVLSLYYLGGMNSREIAEFIGASPATIKMRLSRARDKMKEELVAMMSETFNQQKLPAIFTLRIMELVRYVKIQPVPKIPLLSWGTSLTTGSIFLMFMVLGQYLPVSLSNQDSATSAKTFMSSVSIMPASYVGLLGLGISGDNDNSISSSDTKSESETPQETESSPAIAISDDRIENRPAMFTNRNELVQSRKPDKDSYGISLYRVYITIPKDVLNAEQLGQLTTGIPWMDITTEYQQKPDKKLSPLTVGEAILKKYPQAEIKILYDEGLNLTKRVSDKQIFLPSVIIFGNDQSQPLYPSQYMGLLVDETETKIQVSDVEADNTEQLLDPRNWNRLIMPDRMFFSIDGKFQNDLDRKIISEELMNEFEINRVSLSPNAIISGSDNKWRISQEDFVFSVKKEDNDSLGIMIVGTQSNFTKPIWKNYGRHSAAINQSIKPFMSNTINVLWEPREDRFFGWLDFQTITEPNPEYITLYPGEILDVSKPPLMYIDSTHALTTGTLSSDDRIENRPEMFTNRKELAQSRKPMENSYGLVYHRIYVKIPTENEDADPSKESPNIWSDLLKDEGNTSNKLSPKAIIEWTQKKYPQAEVKILISEYLNLTRRIKGNSILLPSIISFIDEKGERDYMAFAFIQSGIDSYLFKALDNNLAKFLNPESWNRSIMPEGFLFFIDPKFRNDFDSKKISNKLIAEFAKYSINLSPNAEISGGDDQWKIHQDDMMLTISRKQDDGALGIMFQPVQYDRKFKEINLAHRQINSNEQTHSISAPDMGFGINWDNDNHFGFFEFSQIIEPDPEYITLYPGEILDISKPPLMSIDSTHALKPRDKE